MEFESLCKFLGAGRATGLAGTGPQRDMRNAGRYYTQARSRRLEDNARRLRGRPKHPEDYHQTERTRRDT